MSAFHDLLAKTPVICDGAVGTQLHAKSGRMDQCLDHLNVIDPELVKAVHADYIDAGAQIIETNTFGANSIRLAAHDLSSSVKEINTAGVLLAKEAAGDKALVAGSIGPIGKLLAPFGPVSLDEARNAFAEQSAALAEAGADVIFVETMADIHEATAAVETAKSTGLPVVAMMSFAQEGRTMMGVDAVTAVRVFQDLGADVVGANCGTGFHDMLSVIGEMMTAADRPVIAQPNAGFPQFVEGRLVYRSSPSYMADCARKFAELGVAIIGGCCGTTPEHIRAIANALGDSNGA